MSAPLSLAERQAARALEQTSNDGLLTTFAALTHRIHAAEQVEGVVPSDVRLQRDMVRAEILRRMAPDGRMSQ